LHPISAKAQIVLLCFVLSSISHVYPTLARFSPDQSADEKRHMGVGGIQNNEEGHGGRMHIMIL